MSITGKSRAVTRGERAHDGKKASWQFEETNKDQARHSAEKSWRESLENQTQLAVSQKGAKTFRA